jgi:hypothetical protein
MDALGGPFRVRYDRWLRLQQLRERASRDSRRSGVVVGWHDVDLVVGPQAG